MTTDVIAARFPYDSPHTPDVVTEAAYALSALVRYLNNATGPGNAQQTLHWASTVDRVLGGVSGAVYGLGQLIPQLATALRTQATNPALYDDRHDRPAAITATEAADVLHQAAVVNAELAAQIEAARVHTHHLGNNDPEGN